MIKDDLDQMTREEVDEKFYKLLANSTPELLALLIQEFEKNDEYKGSNIIPMVKTFTFWKMRKLLNIPEYTAQRVRGVKSELHMDTEFNQSFLLLSKKDKEKDHLVYPKLYDQHKDELLQMIESRSADTPEKEVVLK